MGSITTARPGSRDKIEVMRERAEAGEPLFLDGDNDQPIQIDPQRISRPRDLPPAGGVEGYMPRFQMVEEFPLWMPLRGGAFRRGVL